jgi:hypothetical protein
LIISIIVIQTGKGVGNTKPQAGACSTSLQIGCYIAEVMKNDSFEEFSNNKIIPDIIRKSALRALSFYPELKDIHITFRFSENMGKSFMQAQPEYVTMLRSPRKRAYLVKLRRYFILKGKKVPVHDISEDVMIGWLGHELGHVMDYLRKNAWTLLLFGVGYLSSKSFIISAERIADTYAVNYGLGDYILATKHFILHQAGMPEKYIRKINRLYLPPEEVMELMRKRLGDDPAG